MSYPAALPPARGSLADAVRFKRRVGPFFLAAFGPSPLARPAARVVNPSHDPSRYLPDLSPCVALVGLSVVVGHHGSSGSPPFRGFKGNSYLASPRLPDGALNDQQPPFEKDEDVQRRHGQ